ncbi:MAG: hypothetical protein M5T61_16810 [Acidimicrobiia bacterium]|nr:hypothetical protein [Acidimicrobiia bacterium]
MADLNRALRIEGARVLDGIIGDAVDAGVLHRDAGNGAAVAMLVGPVLFPLPLRARRAFLRIRRRRRRSLHRRVRDGRRGRR